MRFAALIALCLFAAPLCASTMYWESATPAGNVWDVTTAQWHLDAPGGALTVWDNSGNHDAVFGTNAAAVTLAAPVTARSVQFTIDGFSLQGAALTLAGGTGTIDVGANATATVSSVLGGGTGLTKTGAGTLILFATNTYSGATAVNAGTLKLDTVAPVPVTQWVADSLAGADGSSVTQWTDTRLGKNAVTYGTAPLLNTANLINGHKSVKFNGTNQSLQIAAADSTIAGTTEYCVAVVFRPAATGSAVAPNTNWYNNAGLVDAEVSFVVNDWGTAWSGANTFGGGAGAADKTCYSAPLNLNETHIAVFTQKGGTLTISVNGVVSSLAGAGSGARLSTRIAIGCLNGINGQFYNGEIAEFQLFNTGVLGGQMDKLAASLATKYGVTIQPGQSSGTSGSTIIPDASALTVAGGGAFDLNGHAETVGSLAGAGNVALGAGALTTGGDGTTTTFDGVISGAGGIAKAGAGTFKLTGANTYSGNTVVNAGVLQYGSATCIPNGVGKGSVVSSAGATLDLNGFSPTLGGLNGSGIVTSSVAGPVTLSVGSNNSNTAFSGVIQNGSGVVSLRKAGTGIFTVSGANSYSGPTFVDAGTLSTGGIASPIARWAADDVPGNDGDLVTDWVDSVGGKKASQYTDGNGAAHDRPRLNTSALMNGHKTLKFDGVDQTLQIPPADSPLGTAGDFTVAAVFKASAAGAGPAAQWYQNTGIVDAEISGVTTDWGLAFNSARQVGAGLGLPDITNYSAPVALDTPHVAVYSRRGNLLTLNVDGAVTMLSSGGTQNRTPYQVLFGSENTTAGGGGVVHLAHNFLAGEMAEVQMYDVGLQGTGLDALVSALGAKYGIPGFGGAGQGIPQTSPTTVEAAATLDISGGSVAIDSVSGAAGSLLTLNGGCMLAVGGADVSSEFGGAISGSGMLVKNGAGTLTLSGASSYTGATSIHAGTLLLTGNAVSSTFSVESGATLAGSGIAGPVIAAAGAIVSPGNGGPGKLSTGALSLNTTTTLNFELGTSSDQIAVTGNILFAGTINIVTGAGFDLGTYKLISYTGTLTTGTTNLINPTQFGFELITSIPKEIDLDVQKLVVKSITRADTNPTAAPSVDYTVTFGTNVTGVDVTDFVLTKTSGNITQESITQVSQVNAKVYTVSVATGSGEGTLRLDLVDDNSIKGPGGASLGGEAPGDGSFNTGEEYTIDRTSPTVTIDQAAGQEDPTETDPIKFTVVFNDEVTDFEAADVTVGGTAGGSVTQIDRIDGSHYTVSVGGFASEGDVTVALAAGVAHDIAGNPSLASTSTDNTVSYDLAGTPQVTRVSALDNDGAYKSASTIAVTISFTKTVYVTGAPTLALNSGANARATYVSGSGTRTLQLDYLVIAGDASPHLDYTSPAALTLPNDATIRDLLGEDASLALPDPASAQSLGGTKNISIDTQNPQVNSVSSTLADGTYGAGTNIDIVVNCSEAAFVEGSPKLLLNVGAPGNEAVYASGSGTNGLTFTYIVQPGQSTSRLANASSNALSLDGGKLNDAAGNALVLSLPSPGSAGALDGSSNIAIDAIAPVALNVASTTAEGIYGSGAQIEITIQWSKPVNVAGAPKLAMQTGRANAAAAYLSGTGTSTLTFLYLVTAGDMTVDLDYTSAAAIDLDGGGMNDALGNTSNLTLPQPGAAGSLGANAAIGLATEPLVTSIAPAFGPIAGGTTITILGSNLDNTTVMFGGAPGLVLTSAPAKITVATPAHAEGTVSVTVTNPAGATTQPNAFTFVAAPSLASVTPNKGPIAGGQTVTLSGTGLVPGSTITFGGVAATNVSGSANNLTARTPAHSAGSVSVLVQTPFGQSFTLNNGYTYNAPPVLSGSPVVTPAFLAATRPVTVAVSFSDPEGDPVTVSFDWGDGSSSTDNHHTYAAAGSYTVTVHLSDGYNDVVAQQITLTVAAAPELLTISKMAGSFSFKTAGKDKVQVSGSLPNFPAGFVFAGKKFDIDIGGATASFTLDAKGKAKSGLNSIALKLKFKKEGGTQVFVGGPVPFQVKLGGALVQNWADEGITPTVNIPKGATITMVTDVFFGGRLFSASTVLKLSSKAAVGGKFSK